MSTIIYNALELTEPKKAGGFVPKPKSAATLQAERVKFAYEKKSNRCPKCFMVRSRSGAHCDD